MTNRRFAASVLAALVVAEMLAAIVHGFVLDADYEPYRGTLLRGGAGGPAWQMVFLPVAHLFFVCSLVWIYARLSLRGGVVRRGLVIGVLGWAIGQAPLWLLWYAEQPWPDSLVGKQLALELASSLLIGLTVAAVAGHQRSTRSADGIRST
jgi:hypothetical protein